MQQILQRQGFHNNTAARGKQFFGFRRCNRYNRQCGRYQNREFACDPLIIEVSWRATLFFEISMSDLP